MKRPSIDPNRLFPINRILLPRPSHDSVDLFLQFPSINPPPPSPSRNAFFVLRENKNNLRIFLYFTGRILAE